jgi:hypothetical protein
MPRLSSRQHSCAHLHERKYPSLHLREIWKDDAWQRRLWDALDRALGGLPAGIATQPVVLRGKPGQVLTSLARLVHAHCPVLAIPPACLAREAGYGLRGWALRHRWTKATPNPPSEQADARPAGHADRGIEQVVTLVRHPARQDITQPETIPFLVDRISLLAARFVPGNCAGRLRGNADSFACSACAGRWAGMLSRAAASHSRQLASFMPPPHCLQR